jgi:hypothetical protein
LVPRGYISETELNLDKLHTSAQAAVKEIAGFYRNYHSYRFVKRDLVICLNHPPSPALIDRLNREFADIITDGEIRLIEPLPEEAEDTETLDLHRLWMRFNRADFARLRQMIDAINAAE